MGVRGMKGVRISCQNEENVSVSLSLSQTPIASLSLTSLCSLKYLSVSIPLITIQLATPTVKLLQKSPLSETAEHILTPSCLSAFLCVSFSPRNFHNHSGERREKVYTKNSRRTNAAH